jgi:hypothetical protein
VSTMNLGDETVNGRSSLECTLTGKNTYRFPLLLLCIAISGLCNSQQLNLFEEIENDNSISSRRTADRASGRGVGVAEPEFTLVGTSRIDGNYSAIIEHRGGDTLVVRMDLGSSADIPGYPGYKLVDVDRGNISISYPENIPCVEFRGLGVSCDDVMNIAALSLANGEPLLGKEVETSLAAGRSNETAADELPANPFEALLSRENNVPVSNRDGVFGRTEQFAPRRIDPEDVPPGMNVISTPFGDRLVEQ